MDSRLVVAMAEAAPLVTPEAYPCLEVVEIGVSGHDANETSQFEASKFVDVSGL